MSTVPPPYVGENYIHSSQNICSKGHLPGQQFCYQVSFVCSHSGQPRAKVRAPQWLKPLSLRRGLSMPPTTKREFCLLRIKCGYKVQPLQNQDRLFLILGGEGWTFYLDIIPKLQKNYKYSIKKSHVPFTQIHPSLRFCYISFTTLSFSLCIFSLTI